MLLKKGSTGEDVKKLQTKLGLTADGSFGSGTEAKVKEWQTANGLTADGIVGNNTWQKMGLASTTVNEDVVIPTSVQIDFSKLKGHVPDSVLTQISEATTKFGLNTPLKLAHFLAQCSHESGGFKTVSENLNYSADGLMKLFGKHFPGNLAESYARNPEKIASRIYASRMGNGDETTKEGYKFRGRGFIQLTGKENYTAFGKSINQDLVSNPDLVATQYPLLSAAWFFQRCLPKCTDASDLAVSAVTKCVNGGSIGLDKRIVEFKTFYNLLS
jgi:putative chitinase